MSVGSERYNAKNITSSTATQLVRTGAAVLKRVVINTQGTGATSTVTVYDGVDNTGAKLATIDSKVAIGSIMYEIACAVGIYIETTAATTKPDVTIIWSV